MKNRENRAPPSADLLVCFPTRAHLTLMPKTICSPARSSEPSNRHRHRRHPSCPRGGQASPLLWAKTTSMGADISEPTSPKVTCAGQIKVRHKPNCKNWQSVMEEIERIHNSKKQKKRPNWMETFGLKKETMQFLACLRTIRFNFRCFGTFPESDITSDDEDEDEEEDDDEEIDGKETSKPVFSKWFMVLQENQKNRGNRGNQDSEFHQNSEDGYAEKPSIPPPNALLLMRCRSAPVKKWLEDESHDENREENEEKNRITEEKQGKKKQSLVFLMENDTDFYKCSTEVVKETWIVGGRRPPLSRSLSWKR